MYGAHAVWEGFWYLGGQMVMRRVFALGLCVFALAAIPVAAADAPTEGIVVGVNAASAGLTGFDAVGVSTGYKPGVYIGGFLTWPLFSVLAIQPEIAYAQKHFTATDTTSGFVATESWDWIEVP